MDQQGFEKSVHLVSMACSLLSNYSKEEQARELYFKGFEFVTHRDHSRYLEVIDLMMDQWALESGPLKLYLEATIRMMPLWDRTTAEIQAQMVRHQVFGRSKPANSGKQSHS